jgi:hypothetical protein
MDEEIKLLQGDSDFYAHLAGNTLAALRKMYNDLDQQDVTRVVEYLTGFAKEFLPVRPGLLTRALENKESMHGNQERAGQD